MWSKGYQNCDEGRRGDSERYSPSSVGASTPRNKTGVIAIRLQIGLARLALGEMNFPVRAVWKMNFSVIRWFSNLIALGEKMQAVQKEVSTASALVSLAVGSAFLSDPLE